MAIEPEGAAGTPAEPVDDGIPPGTGTPAAPADDGTVGAPANETDEAQRLREEVERLAQANAQLLGEKTKFEQTSRENEELRRRVAEGGNRATDTRDPRAEMAQQLAQDYATVNDPRFSVDERIAANARITNANIQYTRMLEADNAFQRELLKVPLEDRAEVEARSRAQGVPPAWALKDLKAERFDRANAAPSPTPTTPATPAAPKRATHVTPVAGSALRDAGVTEAEHDQLIVDAGPPRYDMEARRKLDKIDRGLIKVRAG